jgi:uncharacterized protein
MLLKFEASNYRSILEPVELSMIAVDEDRSPVHWFELLSEGVLSIAGIYGPNASGKSNVIEALAWLSMAVRRSLREGIIPREPFKFGDSPNAPSSYEIEIIADAVRYAYRLVVDDSEVQYERLDSYPLRQPRMLFERENQELRFRRGLGGLTGARELLTPTTLALSAVMRFAQPEVQPFGRELAEIGFLGIRRRTARRLTPFTDTWTASTERMFEDQTSLEQLSLFDDANIFTYDLRASALAMLRFADLGIGDVRLVDSHDDPALPQQVRRGSRRQLRLIHRVEEQELPFDLAEESAGTQTWFALIGPVLSALRRGRILLFDEIDASLHPRLSARLLELFQDPETNPRGAQLIFTTHDTSLLNHMNRDEVWLTEKGINGATTLTALAEYGGDKVRRSLNLEKAYLQGRFGAVPELDQFILRRALGMLPDDT